MNCGIHHGIDAISVIHWDPILVIRLTLLARVRRTRWQNGQSPIDPDAGSPLATNVIDAEDAMAT